MGSNILVFAVAGMIGFAQTTAPKRNSAAPTTPPGQTMPGNPATTKPKQPTGTRIGPHRIGETLNEWLTAEEIDLDKVCGNGVGFDDKACRSLQQISETGNGNYHDGQPIMGSIGFLQMVS